MKKLVIVTREQELINKKQASLQPTLNPATLAVRAAVAQAGRKVSPVNCEKRKKILEFRAGFADYGFASVDELKTFEAGIMDMKPTLDTDAFNDWWRNYAAVKGWNEHLVLAFIRDYIKSRE